MVIRVTDRGRRNTRSGRRSNRASQVVTQRNAYKINVKGKMKIGTWNVRTMLKYGKLEEIKSAMLETGIDILGVCETRWESKGDLTSDSVRVIYSGSERSGQNGAALIVGRKWGSNVLNTFHINGHLIVVKIKASPVNLVIIQVYMPTTNSRDEEVGEVYD